MSVLSKIDADLLQVNDLPKHVVNLELTGDTDPINSKISSFKNSLLITESSYSNTVQLPNHEYVTYHLSHDFKCITLYNLNDINNSKTINIHLPLPTLNQQFTFSILIFKNTLRFHLILENGVFLTIDIPINYILSAEDTSLPADYFNVQTPYDFSVRVPHYLFSISPDFTMVFLEDGGLLGLKSIKDTNEVEPILFNDNSYLQSFIGKVFRSPCTTGKTICCTTFQDRYLIVLTQFCKLKIWDLQSFNLIQEYDLSEDLQQGEERIYESVGNYMSIFNNFLTIYSPFGKGAFQIGHLTTDTTGLLSFKLDTKIPANLSSSSIWFLADLKLMSPIDMNLPSSFINLITLWKSGNVSKLQILNIANESLQEYQWLDINNNSIHDITSDFDCNTNMPIEAFDFDKIIFKLKAQYSPQLFERAQSILSENNIVILPGDNKMEENREYLANLETILRDLKNQCNEVSTLTIYRDEIIVVNCLKQYVHSVYKLNSTIENLFFNINTIQEKDELINYLKVLNAFSSTLPREMVDHMVQYFIDISTGEISKSLSLPEKFSLIFKRTPQSQIDIDNMQKLYSELNTIDVVSALNNLINNHLFSLDGISHKFMDCIASNTFIKGFSLESLYQMVNIHFYFVLKVLLTFVLLDTDLSIFEDQITRLLDLFYKQALFIKLYQQDKKVLIDEIFKQTTKYGFGAKIYSYSEWNSFIQFAISNFYKVDLNSNPYLDRMFDAYVIQTGNTMGHSETRTFLKNISIPFTLRGDIVQDFLQAMVLFVSKEFDKSYELFQMHNEYAELETKSLPSSIVNLTNDDVEEDYMWTPLIKSLDSQDGKSSRFNFNLSCLFDRYGNCPEVALRAIKRSLEYTMTKGIDLDIATLQHQQLLNLLIHFEQYDEVIDVLRLSHSCLPLKERHHYFEQLIRAPHLNEKFLSRLFTLSRRDETSEKEDFLNSEDYSIVDELLTYNLRDGSWKSHKQLFSFRLINGFEREAAEVIYNFIIRYADHENSETKRRYYLMVVNILSTFDNTYDQWLINGCNVVTLADVQLELSNI